MIKIKRVYDTAEELDGYRILVDRLWPRGISKQKGKIDLWLKEIAPSNEIRQWFHHDREKWSEFKQKYKKELEENEEEVNKLRQIIKDHTIVTFVYSAKDTDHNNAVVLESLFR